MSNDQLFCNHAWEQVWSAEDQYMQCTKCGYQNPLGLFQHWDTQRDGPAVKWPPRDNGGKLPAGLTPIRNTTGHGILISTYPRFDPSNYFTVRISIEEYNRTKHLQAVILHHRYWHDHQGQPHRNPTKQPLLHNGGKPR